MKPLRAKSSRPSGKAEYSGLHLEEFNENGINEYSATPGDYWQMGDKDKFKGMVLVATERRGVWRRSKVLKQNPTLGDVKKWYRKIEPHGI